MKELLFNSIAQNEITDEIAQLFIETLIKQKKVNKPTIERIKSCRELLLCYQDKNLIAIGAVKEKTNSDFEAEKADVSNIALKFTWELGYIYVDDVYRGLSLSNFMTRLLLKGKEKENIMASTELYPQNAMLFVLEKNGFHRYGKPWASKKHDGILGLFLKFKVGEYAE